MNRILVAAIACGLIAATRATAQTPTLPAPRFEARTDVVLVDVVVVDSRGRPVTDLDAKDFTLEVSGRGRSITSLQYVATNPAPPRASSADAATRTREALTSSNIGTGTGRLILIAVDESNLQAGAAGAVLNAAESLLDRLAPGDLVGFARLPIGNGVEFTANRALVLDALRRPSAGDPRQSFTTISLSEAQDFDNGRTGIWPAALRRECPEPDPVFYEACRERKEEEARMVLVDQERRTATTVRALEGLFSRLRPLGRPVNMVLISEGLFVNRTGGAAIDQVSRMAADARVSMHIVLPARRLYDMQNSAPRPAGARDEHLLRQGLEQLAAGVRGALFTPAGGGDAVFERISSELSGYYLLGFEPTDRDRDGGDKRIDVKVQRRGVTVRARRTFSLPAAGDPSVPAAPGDRLRQLLASPLPTPGLAIRVATHQATSPDNERVRVVVGAEIGAPAATAATVTVGLLVVDRAGRPVVDSVTDVPLEPSHGNGPSPRLFLTSITLPPGGYSLRLAAIDPDGQAGAVHHTFSAGLTRIAGGFSLSDIVIAPAPAAGKGPRPSPSAVVAGDSLLVMLDAQHTNAAALPGVKVAFDVIAAGRPTPVTTVDAPPANRPENSESTRTFATLLPVEPLPAGEYVIRARVETPSGAATTVERPFRVVKPDAPRAGAPAAAGARAAIVRPVPPLAHLTVPMPRFRLEDVLRPQVVNAFLDHLQTAHPVSPAVRSLIEQAKNGEFAAATTIPADANDAVLVSFVGGLAALKQRQVPQAMTLFQRALRGAPDFIGVAFFLGAAHAAEGRDREAAGAWQMSLLSREAEPAHPLLVDALLRVGDAQRALDAMERAPETWKATADRAEREALAQAQAGRDADALATLTPILAAGSQNPDLLLVGIQLLYRRHTTAPLEGDDRTRFDDWTKRYERAGGPQRLQVAEWRSAVFR